MREKGMQVNHYDDDNQNDNDIGIGDDDYRPNQENQWLHGPMDDSTDYSSASWGAAPENWRKCPPYAGNGLSRSRKNVKIWQISHKGAWSAHQLESGSLLSRQYFSPHRPISVQKNKNRTTCLTKIYRWKPTKNLTHSWHGNLFTKNVEKIIKFSRRCIPCPLWPLWHCPHRGWTGGSYWGEATKSTKKYCKVPKINQKDQEILKSTKK